MRNVVIKTDKLTKKFGDFIATDSISFEVYEGEIFGFLGANGAGKTTAMRMLCGLSTPTSGEATIAGFDIYKEAEKNQSKHRLHESEILALRRLDVIENIRFFGGVYGLSDKEIKEKSDHLIDLLGLKGESKKLVGSLPLGWKQKTCLLSGDHS